MGKMQPETTWLSVLSSAMHSMTHFSTERGALFLHTEFSIGLQKLACGSYRKYVLLFAGKYVLLFAGKYIQQKGIVGNRWFYKSQMLPGFLQVSTSYNAYDGRRESCNGSLNTGLLSQREEWSWVFQSSGGMMGLCNGWVCVIGSLCNEWVCVIITLNYIWQNKMCRLVS